MTSQEISHYAAEIVDPAAAAKPVIGHTDPARMRARLSMI